MPDYSEVSDLWARRRAVAMQTEQPAREAEHRFIRRMADLVQGSEISAWRAYGEVVRIFVADAERAMEAARAAMESASPELLGDALTAKKLELRYWNGQRDALRKVLETPLLAMHFAPEDGAGAPPAGA